MNVRKPHCAFSNPTRAIARSADTAERVGVDVVLAVALQALTVSKVVEAATVRNSLPHLHILSR